MNKKQTLGFQGLFCIMLIFTALFIKTHNWPWVAVLHCMAGLMVYIVCAFAGKCLPRLWLK